MHDSVIAHFIDALKSSDDGIRDDDPNLNISVEALLNPQNDRSASRRLPRAAVDWSQVYIVIAYFLSCALHRPAPTLTTFEIPPPYDDLFQDLNVTSALRYLRLILWYVKVCNELRINPDLLMACLKAESHQDPDSANDVAIALRSNLKAVVQYHDLRTQIIERPEVKRLTAESTDTEDLYLATEARNSKINEEFEDLENQARMENWDEVTAQLDAEVQSLNHMVKSARDENDQANAMYSTVQAQNSDLRKRLNILEKENSDLLERQTAYQTTTPLKDPAELSKELQNWKTDKALAADREAAEASAYLRDQLDYSKFLKESQEQLILLNKKVGPLVGLVEEYKKKITKRDQVKSDADTQALKAEDHLSKLKLEREKLRTDVFRASKRKDELEQLKERVEQKLNEISKDESALPHSLKEGEREFEMLTRENGDEERRGRTLETKSKKISGALGHIRDQMLTTHSDFQSYKSTYRGNVIEGIARSLDDVHEALRDLPGSSLS